MVGVFHLSSILLQIPVNAKHNKDKNNERFFDDTFSMIVHRSYLIGRKKMLKGKIQITKQHKKKLSAKVIFIVRCVCVCVCVKALNLYNDSYTWHVWHV